LIMECQLDGSLTNFSCREAARKNTIRRVGMEEE